VFSIFPFSNGHDTVLVTDEENAHVTALYFMFVPANYINLIL
jgi:hypothetical protein